MAMLKKTFMAAVACGSIAFAASAFAQAGGAAGGGAAGASAGGMAGASMGAASATGTAGTIGSTPGATSSTTGSVAGTTTTGVNTTMNNNAGLSTTNNTLASNSTTLGTNNRMATNNTLGTNNIAGANGIGTNNMLAQNNVGVNAGPGVTNNLGTHGPAGSTSVSSAQAATPGAGIPPTGAPALTTAGGSTKTLGEKGVTEHRRLAREHASHTVHHHLAANVERHHVVHGVWGREMTRMNAREHDVTARLNRDELRHVTAMEGSIVPQPTASLNMNER